MKLNKGDLVWVHRDNIRILGVVAWCLPRNNYEVESLLENEFLGNYPMASLTMLTQKDTSLLKGRLERAVRACDGYGKTSGCVFDDEETK